MAKKRVKVDAKECIMCGACVGSYPEDFEFADDGTAKPITGEADEDSAGVCPVGAISFEE
ncbi:MAG: ferredoxin [Erysipelotrichaceae bacterium]|nr:ferredoxin [Erysipelotrichaceae bacterium]